MKCQSCINLKMDTDCNVLHPCLDCIEVLMSHYGIMELSKVKKFTEDKIRWLSE